MFRRIFGVFLTLIGANLYAQDTSQDESLKLKLATGSPGGAYETIANLMNQHPNIDLQLVPKKEDETGGSVNNLRLLRANEVDLAFIQGDWVYKAFRGRTWQADADEVCTNVEKAAETSSVTDGQSFSDIRVVRPLYPAYLQIIAREGIDSLADLNGKQIAIGSSDSSSHFHAKQLFAATTEITTVECIEKGFQKGQVLAEDANIQAAIFIGTLHNNAHLKETLGSGYHNLEINQETIKRLEKTYPYYVLHDEKISVSTMLVTRANVDRERVNKLTDSLIDFPSTAVSKTSKPPREYFQIREELTTLQSVDIVRKTPVLRIPTPFHSGACEAYQRIVFEGQIEEFEIAGTEKYTSYTQIINSFNEQACQELFYDPSSKLAKLVIRQHPNSDGSRGNLSLFKQDDPPLEFALAQNDCIYDASRSRFPWYEEDTTPCESLRPISDLRAVLPISRIHLQFIARESADISALGQLNTMRVHTGKPNSVVRIHSDRVKDEASIRWEDVGNGSQTWCERLKTADADAVLLPGSFRTPEYLHRECEAEHVPMPQPIVKRMASTFPYYHESAAPLSLRTAEDWTFLTLRLFLVTSESVSPDRVETLFSALWGSWPAIQQHNEHLFTLQEAISATPIVYHDKVEEILIDEELVTNTDLYLWLLGVFTLLCVLVYIATRNESSYNRLGEVDFIARNYGFVRRNLDRIASISTGLLIVFGMFILVIGLNFLIRLVEISYAASQGANNDLLGLSDARAFTWLFGFMASGYEDDIFPNSTFAKFVLSVLALIGVVGPITLVYEYFNRRRDRQSREAQGEASFRDRRHIVICGWNDKASGLIYSLTSGQAPQKRIVIVVAQLAEQEPLKRWNFDKDHVFYVRGQSSKPGDLDRANIHRASAVIVLDDLESGADRAFNSALTAFAVRKMNKEAFLAAELSAHTNRKNFDTAGVSATIDAEAIGNRLLALACVTDHAIDFFLDAITFDDFAEWYTASPERVYQLLPNGDSIQTIRQLAEALSTIGMNLIAIDRTPKAKGALTPAPLSIDRIDLLLSESALDEQIPNDCHIIYAADSVKTTTKNIAQRFAPQSTVSTTTSLPTPTKRESVLIAGTGIRPERLRDVLRSEHPERNFEAYALAVDPDSGLIQPSVEFEELLERDWDRIVVLANRTDFYAVNYDAANTIDGQTILLTNSIRAAKPNANITATLQRLENRPLLKDAGANAIVPVPLIVERLMSIAMFGHTSAARTLLGLIAKDQTGVLREITVAQEEGLLDVPFSKLLMTSFANGRIIGWLPAKKELRDTLLNTEGDFDFHFVTCPSAEHPNVTTGDRLLVIGRSNPTAKILEVRET
ncbi:MAG: hypothetical protein GKR90_13620 [Pseudomonadales bacterium]|nr:hypothetical protein [Pseudomonadales bacterium]